MVLVLREEVVYVPDPEGKKRGKKHHQHLSVIVFVCFVYLHLRACFLILTG